MIPQRKKFYIAGPMTGIPQFNFPAFDVAAASLRSFGYEVVSPVELDDEESRAAALSNETGDPYAYEDDTNETWGDLLSRDVKLIADEVDAVICLPGWEKSKGARLEVFVARTCGKPVYSYEAWFEDGNTPYLKAEHRITGWTVVGVMEDEVFVGYEPPDLDEIDLKGEVRITSETGGQKGKKPQAMGLIPPEALLALSEVYGMGADKYDDHNYLKGYDWSLSFGALLRHVMAAEKGEWLDDESGLPHVMHAAWHCFALFLFEKHGLGTDDRISTVVEGLDG